MHRARGRTQCRGEDRAKRQREHSGLKTHCRSGARVPWWRPLLGLSLLALPSAMSFVLAPVQPSCGTLRPLVTCAPISAAIGDSARGTFEASPRGSCCTAPRACDNDQGHNGADEGVPGLAGALKTRRSVLWAAVSVIAGALASGKPKVANAGDKRAYFQRFPTLFAPLYGDASRTTIRRQVGDNMWALEQNLELGPLQTPLRCVVVRLKDGTLWVHAPLAPTQEFFELVESCADGPGSVAHVVVPTYALEHKVFAKDALHRWPKARLWTAPGQFSFPVGSPFVPDEYVWGRSVSGLLEGSDEAVSRAQIPWIDEIQFETLTAGTFTVGFSEVTFYETAFYHLSSKTLIVTDALAQVPRTVPALNDAEKLLLISKRSTADAFPEDSRESRQVGWEKTALLVSYFFPEHEELDPDAGLGVVTWTDGWHDNFEALCGRLLVPPVVRTLIYAQNPGEVRKWVQRVAARWDFEQVVPAHFEAPVRASRADFQRAFAFLDDNAIDAFPPNDLKRGLQPIADLFVRKNRP